MPGNATPEISHIPRYKSYLLFTNKTHILTGMKLTGRLFVVALVMLGLPLQGALAAIMPLCTKAPQSAPPDESPNPFPGSETHIHPSSLGSPCNQHDMDGTHEPVPDNSYEADEMASACDGAVCHISGSSLPASTARISFAGRFSYPADFDSRFPSLILKQPQHPPLS